MLENNLRIIGKTPSNNHCDISFVKCHMECTKNALKGQLTSNL